jgi:hypothetical protein
LLLLLKKYCSLSAWPHLGASPAANKTKQNKTKQNKTKQNKTKQNKTKQKIMIGEHNATIFGEMSKHTTLSITQHSS